MARSPWCGAEWSAPVLLAPAPVRRYKWWCAELVPVARSRRGLTSCMSGRRCLWQRHREKGGGRREGRLSGRHRAVGRRASCALVECVVVVLPTVTTYCSVCIACGQCGAEDVARFGPTRDCAGWTINLQRRWVCKNAQQCECTVTANTHVNGYDTSYATRVWSYDSRGLNSYSSVTVSVSCTSRGRPV